MTVTARPLLLAAAAASLIVLAPHAPSAVAAMLPAEGAGTPMPSLAPMVKRVSPSVVSIQTRGKVREQRNPLMDDPFFRRFFNMPDSPAEREFQAAGSGVVVDAKQGYIITNAHVVDKASEITVFTQDDRQFKATVVGKDTATDVAVLQVKDAKLQEIALADSDTAAVGDFVVAIGNPFGLQHTVTSGIVSGLGRSGLNEDGYENFIQTDASINPGNSGGALVNLRGELVGINSAILSGNGGGNIGIGFAIPTNMARAVMDQLVKHGEVKRGLLGVTTFTLTPGLAKGTGNADARGALVSQVMEGSAAAKAGVQAGDVITTVNGRAIKSGAELRTAIGLLRVGQKVQLDVLRDGRALQLSAVITEASAGKDEKSAAAGNPHPALAGATFEDTPNGVRVQAVEPRSPAAGSGLRAGDFILAVGRQRIDSIATLREALKEEGSYLLTIRRGDMRLIVPLQ